MSAESGPWGQKDGRQAPPPPAASEPPLDKGQHPVWAVVSTLLLAGFIWWVSGSWVVAGAAIFGLFVHEYGHVLAMNRLGMGPARIYIVPFLGGVARSQRLPQSEWHGVLVALAGPLFGMLATLPFFAAWMVTGGSAWLVGAFAIALINLVNLAPAPPLDGSKALGPVLARIHPLLEKAVMVAIGVLVVWWCVTNGSYIFAGFLALALIGHLRRGVWRPEGRRLTVAEAGSSVGLFVITLVICGSAMLAALLPLAGSVEGAVGTGLRYLEFGR
ncbi:peptidase M50 [Brevundimonas sp. Leaf363]|uniref:metalloprotease n=1 Tax=Brevundimonas sp. Leaf363 TaxID=1736353 RepID=UPI0007001E68|nr:site-2 protease family protein [Brevundimonas sp. Leaf363]KQS55471.1 peptidase M50 [Brevundimonas sp. Leaf363]